ncbi:MAG TPA: hypothetical protein VI731_09780 [Bacteroidia bacterium]|nr:hypothetical protein [Bacteroidia bacterium]
MFRKLAIAVTCLLFAGCVGKSYPGKFHQPSQQPVETRNESLGDPLKLKPPYPKKALSAVENKIREAAAVPMETKATEEKENSIRAAKCDPEGKEQFFYSSAFSLSKKINEKPIWPVILSIGLIILGLLTVFYGLGFLLLAWYSARIIFIIPGLYFLYIGLYPLFVRIVRYIKRQPAYREGPKPPQKVWRP